MLRDGTDSVQLVRGVIESLSAAVPGAMVVGLDDVQLLDDLSTFVVHQIVQRSAAKVVLTVRDGEPIPLGHKNCGRAASSTRSMFSLCHPTTPPGVVGHTGRIDGFASRRPPLGAGPRNASLSRKSHCEPKTNRRLPSAQTARPSSRLIADVLGCDRIYNSQHQCLVLRADVVDRGDQHQRPVYLIKPSVLETFQSGNHPVLGGTAVDRPAQLRGGGLDRLHGCRRISRGHSRAGQHYAGTHYRRTKNRILLYHSNSLSFAPSARRSFPRNLLVLPRFVTAKPDAYCID